MSARVLHIIILLVLFVACRTKHSENCITTIHADITELTDPIKLNSGETVVLLKDYFNDISKIDSIVCDDQFNIIISKGFEEIKITPTTDETPYLSELKVWTEGEMYSILLQSSPRIKTNITFAANWHKYKSIQLAGDINNWEPNNSELTLNDDIWEIELLLDSGEYRYRLVIDGTWKLDPSNPEIDTNSEGEINSLLRVRGPEKESLPQIFLSGYDEQSITIGSNNQTEHLFAFWQNFRITDDCIYKQGTDYVINIPEAADFVKQSYIRIWSSNEKGISNNLVITLDLKKVVEGQEL